MVVALLSLCVCAQAQSGVDWAAHNRYLEIGAGLRQQAYREIDRNGLTSDGTLDAESGTQNAISAAMRWQVTGGWFAELAAQRYSGTTAYQGYLQSGSSLTPYSATTGNVATHYSAQLGYAINANNWAAMPAQWQVIPVAHFSQHNWQRNLVQYSETYAHAAQALGAIAQWQAQPGTVVEVQALAGRTLPAQVSAPAFGFEAKQPGGSYNQWHINLAQDLARLTSHQAMSGWRMAARYSNSRYSHGASLVVAGLQAPPNEHKLSVWTLNVQKQF